MELVHELFVTAVLAVVFSFLVAKLVSVAMAGGAASASPSEPESVESSGIDPDSVSAEKFEFDDRLIARVFDAESRAVAVLMDEAAEKVHRVEAEPAVSQDAEVEEITTTAMTTEGQEVPEAVMLVKEENSGQCCGEEVRREAVEVKSVELAHGHAEIDEEVKEAQREVEEEIAKEDGEAAEEEEDWEGIESTELQRDFAVAANFVGIGSGETNDLLENVGGDVKMRLYGLHKVAIEGPCHEPQPMAFKPSARAKWNAWQRLGNMNPDAAMEQYIKLLSDNVPSWKEGKWDDANKSDVAGASGDLSTIGDEHLKLEGDSINPASVTIAAPKVAESPEKNSENKAIE